MKNQAGDGWRDILEITVESAESTYHVGVMLSDAYIAGTVRTLVLVPGITAINPFRTAVPFWGQTSQISSSLSPKRDCGPKRVKNIPRQCLITSSRTRFFYGLPLVAIWKTFSGRHVLVPGVYVDLEGQRPRFACGKSTYQAFCCASLPQSINRLLYTSPSTEVVSG